tara:strand:- start:9864 stop:11411 length:1548 start_codon:yes stop_codon:yes gene_type:complete
MVKKFLKDYSHKIKSVDEVKSIVKVSKHKYIFCHGVFDIVHPGHIRHLAYAKSIADKLIVSITSDKHIKKGIYRPHIPERLRALNLAAFEMVDYVIIDINAKPLNNLKKIKPSFFAKGFEYSSNGLPKATQEEAKIVNSYGGKIIFTPGDVVYSSSAFLGNHLPKIKYEKLLELMDNENITFKDLKLTIKNFSKFTIHLIGDTIVDTYTRTKFIGGQTKTPTFSVLFNNKDDYIGGAGIVAQHLKAAGAKVVFTSVIGNDPLGKFVEKNLKKNKIKCNLFIDNTRPTTNKNVFIASDYRLLKVDTLDNSSINSEIQKYIIEKIKKIKSNAVVFSDFRHGIYNQLTTNKFIKNIPKKIFKVADSQVASRWGNITDFKNFDLITPNEREARFSLADQDSTVGRISDLLLDICKYKNLILKLGARGVFCNSISAKKKNSYFSLDSFTENIKDSVGSGDALLAYSTLSMLQTNSLLISSIIGSIAAACECEFDGNIPVKPKDVLDKINFIEKESQYKHI